MSMNHTEDLQRRFVVDLYVEMGYNQANQQFVVGNIPIDLREDHPHLENNQHVFYNHLYCNHHIVVHIVYTFCNVLVQSLHLEHHVHRPVGSAIRKAQLNSHQLDRVVVLDSAHVRLGRWYQSKWTHRKEQLYKKSIYGYTMGTPLISCPKTSYE